MDKLLTEQLVSVSQLQRNYPRVIQKAKSTGEPVWLLKKNKLEAVLVSGLAYEELINKIRHHEERLALEALGEYEKQKRAGKLKKAHRLSDLFLSSPS